jgi:hypothetical protein
MHHWLPLFNAAVQFLLFVGLFWYTVETRRIRKISQRQIETSQRQVEISQEQVEGTHKPCLTFSTARRDFTDAVLEMNGAVGAMILRCPESQAQLESVGSGPAINIRYNLTPTNPDSTIARPSGYLLWLKPGDVFLTPIPRGILQANEWICVITYESLSGRHYQTKIIVNNLVLISIEFGPAPASA